MRICFYDTEDYCDVPISAGTDLYTRSAECLIVTYALDEQPTKLWEPWKDKAVPADFQAALDDPECLFIAHKSEFDFNILERALGIFIDRRRTRCTMAQAYSCGLPGSIGSLGAVLGIPEDLRKLVDDGKLIHTFCVPQKGDKKRIMPYDAPEDWERFCRYAVRDTDTLREIYRRLPKHNYSGVNLKWWYLNQLENERGFGFDAPLANGTREFLRLAKAQTDLAISGATGGAIGAATQRNRLLAYLQNKHGLEISNLRAAEVRDWLEADDLDPEVRFLLETRLEASKSSGSKYTRGLNTVGPGSRIRWAIQWSGAGRTGRNSGRNFQPHNMPRPMVNVRQTSGPKAGQVLLVPVKAKWIDEVILPGIRNHDALSCDIVFGGPHEAAALALRHVIVAAPGNELLVADWKNIESRVLAWLAGEEWKLRAYEANDRGTGADLYKLIFSQFFGTSIESVNDTERQAGKVCLSGSTMVLCESGWKRLDSVSVEDRVWDGDKWCSHSGLANNGLKNVVNLCGISLTPDHLVWCGDSWRRADTLGDSNGSTLSQALAAAAENLPSQASCLALPAELPASSSPATAEESNTWLIRTASRGNYPLDVTPAQKRPAERSDSGSTLPQCPMTSTDVDCSIALQLQSRVAAVSTASSGQPMEAAESAYATNGPLIDPPSCDTCRRSVAGIIPNWKWIAEKLTATTSRGISDLSRSERTSKTSDQCAPSLRSEIVYDLKSVGSKHRFTVLGDRGPLLVHNCELAFGFGGGVGALVTMAATYQIDLDPLAGVVLPRATPERLTKAEREWRRAFLEGADYALEPDTYIACDILKQGYRASNAKIDQFKHDLGDAVKQAVRQPGAQGSSTVGRCKVWSTKSALLIELPSGRRLTYWNPRIEFGVRIDPETGYAMETQFITYWTARGKQWRKESSWPGLFVENVVQAAANDVLRAAAVAVHEDSLTMPAVVEYLATLPKWERTALSMDVHDELALDLPKGIYPVTRLATQCTKGFWWSAGLPLAVDTWVYPRYGKRG